MSEPVPPPPSSGPVELLRLQDIRKRFGIEVVSEVLHGIDLRLDHGEFAALIGPSGSGKSTLLNLIGLLDRPSAGQLYLDGVDTSSLDDVAITRLRSISIGFVFQFHHLLSALSAEENLAMPLAIRARGLRPEHRRLARQALSDVGLADRAAARPSQLSGGQQQRVAIARALIHRPALVLADEPTGNLDTVTADDIFSMLRRINLDRGLTFLIVTHDPRLAARCDRIINLVDGRIASDQPNTPTPLSQLP